MEKKSSVIKNTKSDYASPTHYWINSLPFLKINFQTTTSLKKKTDRKLQFRKFEFKQSNLILLKLSSV